MTSLSDKLAALAPPQPGENRLARPQGGQGAPRSGQGMQEMDAARSAPDAAREGDVSSPAALEQAREDVRATLSKFGREAPTRRSAAERPQRPGGILDIRV